MRHADFCTQFLTPNASVLDIGSGKGIFLVEMAQKGFHVSGVETSVEYIAETKEKARQANVTVEVIQAHAEKLPFADHMFEFANCSEVSEHVDDPVALVREIFRVLKPGGKAYISFHNRFGIFDYHYHLYFINWMPRRMAEWVLHLCGKQKVDSPSIGRQKLSTMHYFSYRKAVSLLEQVGFSVEDIRVDRIHRRFRYTSFVPLVCYRLLLRPLYFNTFHLVARKP